jgi:DNA topoisomerase-3
MENRKGYSCWAKDDPGCGFVIWKAKAGKTMNATIIRELIRTGRTERQVTGFRSRAGKSFRAKLSLWQNEEGRWRVEFNEPWAKDGYKPPDASEEGTEGESAAVSGAATATVKNKPAAKRKPAAKKKAAPKKKPAAKKADAEPSADDSAE